MQVYLVVSLQEFVSDSGKIIEKNLEKLRKHHPLIPGQVWIVADKDRTTSDEIREALGIGLTRDTTEGGEAPGAHAMVVRIERPSVSGFGSMNIWERIEAWWKE